MGLRGGGVRRWRRWVSAAGLALALVATAGCESEPEPETKPDGRSRADARTQPEDSGGAPGAVARVCEKPKPGPAKAPSGAVTVDPSVPGDLSAKTNSSPEGTTFWLKPGRHRLADDRYAQVEPKDGNTYIGAPGAVLDGRRTNQYAFGGGARDVTIRHLTVQGFVAPHDEGVVNHDSADGWVIEHSGSSSTPAPG